MKKSRRLGPLSVSLLFCGVLLMPSSLFAETENNNTPAAANILAINSSASGRLGDSIAPSQWDLYDWYSITVPSDGRLKVMSTASGSNFTMKIYMYRMPDDMNSQNPGGDYSGPSGDAVNDTVVDDLHACTVWIEVEWYSGKGSYTLTSTFEPAALTNDQEINDTPVVAQTLAINSTTTGHMGYHSYFLGTDTYDWYKVTTPLDGRLTFTSVTSAGNLDVQLYIYRAVYDMKDMNSGGDYIGSGGDPVNDTISDLLRAGTYYLQMIRRSGVGSYTLRTDFMPAALVDDAEPDDIPNQAVAISMDSSRTGHMGYYSNALGQDNFDWYKITVTSAQTLTFRSLVVEGDLDFQMYLYKTVSDMTTQNPSGDYAGGGGTQLRDTASADVTPGTYYLQVERRSGIGSYILACGSGSLTVAVKQALPQNPGIARAIPSAPFLKSTIIAGGATVLSYGVPVVSNVALEIYSLSGRKIAAISRPGLAAGIYEERLNSMTLPAGVYCCRLRVGTAVLSSIIRFAR